jgi:hypothetical protein
MHGQLPEKKGNGVGVASSRDQLDRPFFCEGINPIGKTLFKGYPKGVTVDPAKRGNPSETVDSAESLLSVLKTDVSGRTRTNREGP